MIWDADPSQVLLQSKDDLDRDKEKSSQLEKESSNQLSEPDTPLLPLII